MDEQVQARVSTQPEGAVPARPAPAADPAGVSQPCATCGQPLPTGLQTSMAQPTSPQTSMAAVPPPGGFTYAVGRLTTQFPTLGVEKEFMQLVGEAPASALVEVDQLKAVLENPQNRYLGRHLCWVFVIQHVDALTLIPRDADDVAQLVDALTLDENSVQAVVGGPATWPAPAGCFELGLPAVAPEQLLSFSIDEFIQSLPRDEKATGLEESSYRTVVRDLFTRLTRRSDNRGVADEHRALNYLALRYPPLYHATVQALGDGKALIGVDARHSHAGSRRVVSVRLTFRHRRNDVTERYRCLVDVTDLFPFLVSPLSLTYD